MQNRLQRELAELRKLRGVVVTQLRSAFELRGLEVTVYRDDEIGRAVLKAARSTHPAGDLLLHAFAELQSNAAAATARR